MNLNENVVMGAYEKAFVDALKEVFYAAEDILDCPPWDIDRTELQYKINDLRNGWNYLL